jgi:hypothetical protein
MIYCRQLESKNHGTYSQTSLINIWQQGHWAQYLANGKHLHHYGVISCLILTPLFVRYTISKYLVEMIHMSRFLMRLFALLRIVSFLESTWSSLFPNVRTSVALKILLSLLIKLAIVRHLPDWLPGTRFKHAARECSKHVEKMLNDPFNALMSVIVSLDLACCFLWIV